MEKKTEKTSEKPRSGKGRLAAMAEYNRKHGGVVIVDMRAVLK